MMGNKETPGAARDFPCKSGAIINTLNLILGILNNDPMHGQLNIDNQEWGTMSEQKLLTRFFNGGSVRRIS